MTEADEGVGVAEDEGVGADFKGVVTEVLVSQIEQGTVASRDGRLRIGDQILQVCTGNRIKALNFSNLDKK